MTTGRFVRELLAGAILCCAAAVCGAQGRSTPASTSAPALDPKVNRGILPAEYHGQPLLWIPELGDIAKFSGDMDERPWKDAATVTLLDPGTRKPPRHETKAMLFCSDKSLYIGVRAAEPRGDLLKLNGELWERDEVEIFLEPFRDTIKRAYYHIQVDATGATAFRRYHVYPRYFQERALQEEWSPRVAVAACKDKDGWSVEIRLPFDQIKLDPAAKEGKTLWRLNICRSRPARGEDGNILWTWSRLDGRSFQSAARFGYALPEAFSSKALIDETLRTTEAPADPSVARATDPKVQAEVDKAIEDLGTAGASRDDAAVKKVAERITPLAKEGQAMYGLIERKLGEAAAKAKRDRLPSYSTLRDFAYRLDQARPEDDPPPDETVKRIANFEARVYKDGDGKSLNYRLAKPKDYDPNRKYPLLIWLHGAAEGGDDNYRQLYSGVWDFYSEAMRAKYPCFILAPQCPRGTGWADMRSNPDSRAALTATSCYRMAEKPNDTTRLLLETFAATIKDFPAIDAGRVYITGSSMGGFGTYECIMRKPDFFAAAMPVCGGGDETRAALIAMLPIWIFHGEKDEAVKVEASRIMFRALKDAGGDPKYTEVPGAPHALGAPYMDDKVLQWLFAQKRKQ
ncbi:MAG: prolyl oligopeptidase family serine peptidase [Phycisphaerae bacterium]